MYMYNYFCRYIPKTTCCIVSFPSSRLQTEKKNKQNKQRKTHKIPCTLHYSNPPSFHLPSNLQGGTVTRSQTMCAPASINSLKLSAPLSTPTTKPQPAFPRFLLVKIAPVGRGPGVAISNNPFHKGGRNPNHRAARISTLQNYRSWDEVAWTSQDFTTYNIQKRVISFS